MGLAHGSQPLALTAAYMVMIVVMLASCTFINLRVLASRKRKLELAQAAANERERAIRDELTGLHNRRFMLEIMHLEGARVQRNHQPLLIAQLDLDHFKHINDTHGHQTGDEALQHLASVIRENLRPQDSVARYGGEEFVILLPDTDVDLATATLVRLQRALTKRYFLARQQKLLITFSAGVAELQADEDTESALDRADKAMYIAKRSGKNRVISAT